MIKKVVITLFFYIFFKKKYIYGRVGVDFGGPRLKKGGGGGRGKMDKFLVGRLEVVKIINVHGKNKKTKIRLFPVQLSQSRYALFRKNIFVAPTKKKEKIQQNQKHFCNINI